MNTYNSPYLENAEATASRSAVNIMADFKQMFTRLNKENSQDDLMDKLYRDDVVFEDSFHYVNGRDAFKSYCNSLYENLESSQIMFHDEWVSEDKAALSWTLYFKHPRLKKGNEVQVQGMTKLLFDDQIYFHRDYFDGGIMLYEHIPLVGSVIKKIKQRML